MVNINFWKNKKVLITGHTGFKGGWLSFFLKNTNCKLYGISLKPEVRSFFNQTNLKSYFFKSKFINIKNFKSLDKNIKNFCPEIIFHMAAQPIVLDSYRNPLETFQTNIIGTANLINICKNLKSIKVIIIITTDKCYENSDKSLKFFKETDKLGGKDPYSASKACCEILSNSMYNSFLKEKGIKLATVRAGNVVGGGDYSDFRIVPDIYNSIDKNKVVKVRNPHAIRPWQHVMEPVYGYIKLAEKIFKDDKLTGAWNFGPEKKNIKSVQDLVETLNDIKQFKYNMNNKKKTDKEASFLALDISKIKKSGIWKPQLNFKETLKLTSEWYTAKNKVEITNKQIKKYLNGFL